MLQLAVFLLVAMSIASATGMISRDVSPALFCAACKATVEQLFAKLAKRGSKASESDVMDAIDTVCDAKNFRAYDFIPPKMVLGCEQLMHFDEDVERLFLARPRLTRDEIELKLCGEEVTSACVDVDASNPQNKDPSVFIDGEAIETKRVVETPPQKKRKPAAAAAAASKTEL
jgi:hypothetical protein